MTQIKNLEKENLINVTKILQSYFGEPKTKYIDLYLRLLKSFLKKININVKVDYDFSDFEKIFISILFGHLNEVITFEELNNFIKLNEMGLIKGNDLSKINDFSEIRFKVSYSSILLEEKRLSKQTHIIYHDDQWIVLLPLTHEASQKYGAGTRWCTSSMKSDSFYEYTMNGMLIYFINKDNGYKIALHSYITENEKRLSFWNSNDDRIDSMEAKIPQDIMSYVIPYIINPISNYLLCSEELRKLYKKNNNIRDIMEQPVENEERNILDNNFHALSLEVGLQSPPDVGRA